MDHEGQENRGTGPRDVFDILVKACPERVLSLTYQLGESPEDNIIHALCLIVLQKEEQALNKLQTLGDNYLANHLAEKWQMSGGKLEEFGLHCGHFQEFTGESLAGLARIFRVLSDRQLCDPLLRNLAYKRAISCDGQIARNCEDLDYDALREEAKSVCGPQFAEWMCSLTDLKSGSRHDSQSRNVGEGRTSLKVRREHAEGAFSLPSPLQASCSVPSYPSHIEISPPPTALFQEDKRAPETSERSQPNAPVILARDCGVKNAAVLSEPRPQSTETPVKHSKTDEGLAAAGSSHLDSPISHNTSKHTTKPGGASNTPPTPPCDMFKGRSVVKDEEEEEEEAVFYAFVIMHAPEDEDLAISIRTRLEEIIKTDGATFSLDFAVPGASAMRCVENAVNDTAFTLLLLTRHFDNRMQELQTNSALLNSIEKRHKYNTVIPLVPRQNRLPRENVPMVLRTLVMLEDNHSFERRVQKFMSPAKIRQQKKYWAQEQRLKAQKERQERLKYLNQQQEKMLRESERARLLEEEHLHLLMKQKLLLGLPLGEGGGALGQQRPNIHIENAQYIMIGNDSTMTVGLGGAASKDDTVFVKEEEEEEEQ